MIKEAYVSFKVAKLLKEKGFNYPCRAIYSPKGIVKHYLKEEVDAHHLKGHKKLCPTYQMTMAWLRTKHIIIVVQPEYFNADGTCSYWGVDIWADDNYEKLQGDYPTYEEAVEAALKYSLENLI